MNDNPYNRPGSPSPYGDIPQQAPQRVILRPPAPNPWVTYTLIGVCVGVFLIQMATQSLIGYDLPAALGMKVNRLILQGQIWRLFTPMFLHASILHIAFNMYALYAIGRGLEQQYGHLRYIILFLISGFAGNVFSFLMSNANSLGASTAIFGLLAADGIFVYQNRELFGGQARALLINIAVLMVINLALGLAPGSNIDNWGHLGGLMGGAAFAWFAGPILQARPSSNGYQLEDQRGMNRVWIVTLVEFVVLAVLVVQRVTLA